MGNVTSTAFSYATLQPISVQDPNGNRVQFAYDASGEMIGQAQMGKKGEDVGDSVDGAPLAIHPALLDSFISDPIQEAAKILRNFTTRTIKDKTRYYRNLSRGRSQPCFEATIGRSTHAHEGSPGTISIKITYWDSQAHPIQHIELTSIDKTSAPTWCIYGATLKNNKGEVVREYHPVLSDTHLFRPYETLAKKATTFLLDPLGRRIATLNADHTWRKTVLSAWEKVEYDEADTVLTSDASQDEDVGSYFKLVSRDLYLPSWYDSKRQPGSDATVFEESGTNAVFHNTPSVEYFDALGRPISSTADKNGLDATTSTAYSCLGYESCRYDALGRTVETVTQDFVQSYRIVRSMDSVAAHIVQNAVNLPVVSWTDGGPLRIYVYDSLGRVTEVWISHRGAEPFISQKNVYGESTSNGEAKNLKGQLYKSFDQSGLSTQMEFDFKGNCLAKTKQLAINYKDELDWSGSVQLEDEVFTSMLQYDAQNHVISAQSPDGDITKTQYNNWGHPNSVMWQASTTGPLECIVAETYYNADQQTALIKHGNGGQSMYMYDEITGNLVAKVITRPNGAKIEHKTYIHDCLGRETFVKDAAQQTIFFHNNQVMPVSRFRYDGLGRLISATGREQVNVGSGTSRSFSYSKAPNTVTCEIPSSGREMAEYLEGYKYDLAGNILNMSHKCPNDASIRGWVRHYFYTEKSLLNPAELSNRLSRTEVSDHTETYKYPPPDVYDYDKQGGASGCMTSMPRFSSLSWDFENRLKSSSTQRQKAGIPETTYYVYDGSGFRVRKVTERSSAVNSQTTRLSETLYMDNFIVHRMFSGNGVAVSLEKRSIHVRANKIVGIIESCPVGKTRVTNLMRLKLDDGLEVDKESRIILHEEYSPFGATTYSACRSDITAPAVYRYASYERDQETGLYHVGHRYYAPWLGRWISPDPLGIADGLNRYAYVGNNPIMFVDPEGTTKIEKLGADNGGQKSWLSNAKYYGSVAFSGFAIAYATKKSIGKVAEGNKLLASEFFRSSYELKLKDYTQASAQLARLKAAGQTGDVKYKNPILGTENYNRMRSIANNPFNILKRDYGVPNASTGLDPPSEELYHIAPQYATQAIDSTSRYIPKGSDPLHAVYEVGKYAKETLDEAKLMKPVAYGIDQAEGNRKEDEKFNGAEAHKQGADFLREVEKLDKSVKKLDKNASGAWQTVKNIFVDPNIN